MSGLNTWSLGKMILAPESKDPPAFPPLLRFINAIQSRDTSNITSDTTSDSVMLPDIVIWRTWSISSSDIARLSLHFSVHMSGKGWRIKGTYPMVDAFEGTSFRDRLFLPRTLFSLNFKNSIPTDCLHFLLCSHLHIAQASRTEGNKVNKRGRRGMPLRIAMEATKQEAEVFGTP
mgnify:CR=1 FL=1